MTNDKKNMLLVLYPGCTVDQRESIEITLERYVRLAARIAARLSSEGTHITLDRVQ